MFKLQRVTGLYLCFRENGKLLPVEFVDFSMKPTGDVLSAWDNQQIGIYYVVEHGMLQGYQLDKKITLSSERTPKLSAK